MMRGFVIMALTVISSEAHGSRVEAIGAAYSDEVRASEITGVSGEYSYRPKRGVLKKNPLSIGLGFTRRKIAFKELDSFVVTDQLSGTSKIVQHDLSASISQSVNPRTDLTAFSSLSKSPLATNRSFGIAGSRWMRKDTLKVQLSLGQTNTTQASGEIYDTDQRRLRLPSDLVGKNLSASLTHYTSPLLVTTGKFSFTQRSDRPNAHSQKLGVKRFIKQTHSAIHIEGGHYANVGQLKPESLFGHVQAFSLKSEWHQKMGRSIVGTTGYRYYSEFVTARHDLENDSAMASDSIYAKIKYRFGHKQWLDEANELNSFIEQYSTNRNQKAWLVGFGVVALLGR